MKTIESNWKSFSKELELSDTEDEIIKAAFYAGHSSFLGIVAEINSGAKSSEEKIKGFDRVKAQIDGFFRETK